MNRSDNILIKKLDAFIRKYYKNQLIKGLLYSTGLIIGGFLVVNLLEYFGHFNTTSRAILFWTFVAAAGFLLWKYIIVPLFRMNKLGDQISYDQAATIVGDHFPNVKDKLLNTLQLQSALVDQQARKDLIEASIGQRMNELNPVPFSQAIDLSENRKYLKYALPPILALIIILFTNASIITDSSERLINHSEDYRKPAPFEMVIDNERLEVVEQEPFELRVKVKGNQVPASMMLEIGGAKFRMKKNGKTEFSYVMHVNKNTEFRMNANGYSSRKYELVVLPKPTIQSFSVDLDYPEYTGREDQKVENMGDLHVPEGTIIKWNFHTEDANQLHVTFDDTSFSLDRKLTDEYSFVRQAERTGLYSVITENDFVRSRDSMLYRLNVKRDGYPEISVDEEIDSTENKLRYFYGEIADDYGFTGLAFSYRFRSNEEVEESRETSYTKVPIMYDPDKTADQFAYMWDLRELDIQQGDKIEYFFTVWDNDGINGAKARSTAVRVFRAPTLSELEDMQNKSNEKVKNDLEASMEEAKDIRKAMKEMENELQGSKEMSWQQKQKIEELINRQEELRENLKDVNEEFDSMQKQKEEYQEEIDEELLEKKKMLDELLEELMTDEMKEMMEELRKLLEEYNKDGAQEKMEEMNMSNEELEKQLDVALERFKQMEMDEMLRQAEKKLEDLAEKQEELSEETKEKETSNEDLKKKQDGLNKKMEDIREDIKDIEEKNEELENKRELPDMEQEMDEISNEMKQSSQDIEQGKNKKASEKQGDAAEKMQEMAQQMNSMQMQQQQQQMQEDMDALRALLENLIQISFDQEELMDELKGLSKKDPKYFEVGQRQRKLKDDSELIKDSLFALTKRIVQLESIVNKEINSINRSMDEALDHIGERHTNEARAEQQFAMTSMNNLALLLDEALKSMQQSMAMQMPGTGMCQNPGGKNPKGQGAGVPNLRQMQEKLAQQLEQMKKALKDGNKPGQKSGKKPGGKKEGPGGTPMPGKGSKVSEQLAKMAAQQSEIRRKLEKLGQQLNEDGSGRGNGLKEIAKEMEETEEDIVNKKINQRTIQRQHDILTKLLEHEKAERERGFEEKRRSEEAKNQKISNPEQFSEYKRKKEKELELLRTVPPALKPYYKSKVNEYFNTVE